jgi:hypothetical protein
MACILHHYALAENILYSVKFFENIELMIGNILCIWLMSKDMKETSLKYSFHKIWGKPQDVNDLVLPRAVVHHEIEDFPFGAIRQPTIVKMFHQEQHNLVAALVIMLFTVAISM